MGRWELSFRRPPRPVETLPSDYDAHSATRSCTEHALCSPRRCQRHSPCLPRRVIRRFQPRARTAVPAGADHDPSGPGWLLIAAFPISRPFAFAMLLGRVLRPSRTLFASLTSARRSLTRSSTAELAPYRQGYGTHSSKEPVEPLSTAQGARDFVYSLHARERVTLLRELQRFQSMAAAQGEMQVSPPSSAQQRYVFLHSAIPFIGFGFLDNAIMIVAGTQIELSIGVILGISTMAAAALGNLVSDVAGLGLAGYVEALASRLGLPSPDLNPKQADMWQTRLSSQLGKVIGVTIGCLLGMFPLLFFKTEDEEVQQEPKN